MRKVFQSSPLHDVEICPNTKYVLSFLQQPMFARESTKSKRLLHPHPVLTLNVYIRNESDGTYQDVTGHSLSFFFVTASLIEAEADSDTGVDDREPFDPHKSLVGNSVISGSLYSISNENDFKIINSKYQRAVSEIAKPATTSRAGFKLDLGKQSVIYNSIEALSNDVTITPSNTESNKVIIFILNDLGVVNRGNFHLKIVLYKYEGFTHMIKTKFLVPIMTKLGQIVSDPFKVYRSRQFYKKSNQQEILKQLDIERKRLLNNKVLTYLKQIKVLRDSPEEAKLSSSNFEEDEEEGKSSPENTGSFITFTAKNSKLDFISNDKSSYRNQSGMKLRNTPDRAYGELPYFSPTEETLSPLSVDSIISPIDLARPQSMGKKIIDSNTEDEINIKGFRVEDSAVVFESAEVNAKKNPRKKSSESEESSDSSEKTDDHSYRKNKFNDDEDEDGNNGGPGEKRKFSENDDRMSIKRLLLA